MITTAVDLILADVQQAGLTLYLQDGAPRLTGPRSRITPDLVEALRANRTDIIRRLLPPAARRVVLLVEGRDSAVEKVLEECSPQGHRGRVRHWAQRYPGRTVAGEWLGPLGWVRFLWMSCPAEATC